MPNTLCTYTIAVCTMIPAGDAMTPKNSAKNLRAPCAVVWDDAEIEDEAAWDELGRTAPSYDQLEKLAEYLKTSGQASS